MSRPPLSLSPSRSLYLFLSVCRSVSLSQSLSGCFIHSYVGVSSLFSHLPHLLLLTRDTTDHSFGRMGEHACVYLSVCVCLCVRQCVNMCVGVRHSITCLLVCVIECVYGIVVMSEGEWGRYVNCLGGLGDRFNPQTHTAPQKKTKMKSLSVALTSSGCHGNPDWREIKAFPVGNKQRSKPEQLSDPSGPLQDEVTALQSETRTQTFRSLKASALLGRN